MTTARVDLCHDETFDVVVGGMGAAGSAAALAAHEDGARVLVLEKSGCSDAGGATRVSGGAWFINRHPARAMRAAGPLAPTPESFPVRWPILEEGDVWSQDNTLEIDKGWILRADTLAELAIKIGVEPAVLERTVSLFNEAVERGVDDRFGRPAQRMQPVDQAPLLRDRLCPTPGLEQRRAAPRRALPRRRHPRCGDQGAVRRRVTQLDVQLVQGPGLPHRRRARLRSGREAAADRTTRHQEIGMAFE